MPSFDIVCTTDVQEVDNAVNSVRREIDNRFDFKGTTNTIDFDREGKISLVANDNYKLTAIQEMLKVHITRRDLDARVLDFQKEEAASGTSVRQSILLRQGVDQDTAKKIIKEIKASKIKVQASIRGDELRVDGKKRDDLQAVMSLVKGLDLELPLQFVNFRD